MNHKHVLVEHISNLNTVIKLPLQSTRRIKFTCFDISQNYIVFGATSGGLYVFSRYPCKFIKLVPSKEGPVVQVSVSPDEKIIALSSTKGLVTIIENFSADGNIQYQVYSEHEGSIVTAIKWHTNELYCGDSTGKISVICVNNVLTKAIFQTPCTALMQLDSSVIQLDCFSKYLLASTRSRSYLCNTEKEHYRQIGKKLRDGNFGACFFNYKNISEELVIPSPVKKGVFKNARDGERLNEQINNDIKIFCVRPGARLWEVNIEAAVVRTHQFKSSLTHPPTEIIHLDENVDAPLKITNFADVTCELPVNFNSGKIVILSSKYIFTFNKDGFYIFNPEAIALVFWSNYIKNIKDVKIIKHYIYIYTESSQMHVWSIPSLENLVLKSLFRKQYYLCADLCINYREHILKLMETSDKIHLITVLQSRLAELNEEELLDKILPLLKAINEYSEAKISTQKLKKGIVLVNNAHAHQIDIINDFNSISKTVQEPNLPEAFQTLKGLSSTVTEKLTESTKNLKEKWQILEVTMKNLTADNVQPNTSLKIEQKPPVLENISTSYEEILHKPSVQIMKELSVEGETLVEAVDNSQNYLNIFEKQYESNKINYNIEISKFYNILELSAFECIVDLFNEFIRYMEEKKSCNDLVQIWCYRQYLKHTSRVNFQQEIEKLPVDSDAFKFLVDAFKSLNLSSKCSCSCSFPLPIAKKNIPVNYEIGTAIIKQYWKTDAKGYDQILKDVPYMWKYVVSDLRNNEEISILLPLLIQYNDEALISLVLHKFTYDLWDSAAQLVIKSNRKLCLNCEQPFKEDFRTIGWKSFGKLMIKSIGAPSAVKLLSRYSKLIPSGELNQDFYQLSIFATVIDSQFDDCRQKAVDFTNNIQSEEDTSKQFGNMVEQFLRNQYGKKPFIEMPNRASNILDVKCSFCDIQVKIPFLGEGMKFDCGHYYHNICVQYNKNICIKCKNVQVV